MYDDLFLVGDVRTTETATKC